MANPGPSKLSPSEAAFRRRLLVAVALSILAHAAVAVVLAARPPADDRALTRLLVEDRPEDPPSPPEEEPTIRLGSNTSQATSITWIGADEPEPTAAPTGDIDQAAFRTDIAAAPSLASVQPSPPPTPQSEPAQTEPEPTEVAELEAQPDPAQALPAPELPEPAFVASPAPFGPPIPEPSPTTPDPQPKIEQSPVKQPSEVTEPPEAPDQPPTPPVPPAPASAATPSEKTVGEVSDRESDFSSTIRAPVAKLGKPIAAQGLEILTVAPRFSHYTRITAAPRDPVVRVNFGKNGRARSVELLRSSGVRDVDRPILDAVYQWRARGQQLERLVEPSEDAASDSAPGTTLALEISILL